MTGAPKRPSLKARSNARASISIPPARQAACYATAVTEPAQPETAVPATPPEPSAADAAPPQVRRPNNWVGVGLLAVWLALGVSLLAAPSGVAVFGFVIVGWILAVMAHEFAHAAVAYAAGDWTVRPKGYLSFDPRRYGDLGVSLVIPLIALALGGIGFPGGAVYLQTDMMRSRAWRSAASLAGPAATFLVLLAIALGLNLWLRAGVSGPGSYALFSALTLLGFLQATALLLNLLPVPGLDGFNAIRPWLPRRWTANLRKLEGLTMVLMLLAIFYLPGVSARLFDAAFALSAGVGLDPAVLRIGWRLFHFWQG
jgi:Zn-dependent protease